MTDSEAVHPLPKLHHVELWRADLDAVSPATLHPLLSDEELQRLSRLRHPLVRQRALASRALLRLLLARYLDRPAATLPLISGPQGKPALALATPLRFNLSHSANLFVCGVTVEREIGVDIERVRDKRDLAAITERFFAPDEATWLRQRSAAERCEAFYRLWCRKEALIKGDGRGFALPSNSFSVIRDDEPATTVQFADAGTWRITNVDVDLFPTTCTAVALARDETFSTSLYDLIAG